MIANIATRAITIAIIIANIAIIIISLYCCTIIDMYSVTTIVITISNISCVIYIYIYTHVGAKPVGGCPRPWSPRSTNSKISE